MRVQQQCEDLLQSREMSLRRASDTDGSLILDRPTSALNPFVHLSVSLHLPFFKA